MLGGYQILDLRSIDLTLGSSASNITNSYVLNQLRNLREHIQKDYDFARPLNNQVKPVLIRYRDKKNGEKHEGAIFGSVQVKTNYYTFEISAILIGQTLNIEVVFEEKTNDDGEKYWDIKTAKILLTDNANIEGDLAVNGDLSVGDDVSITGDVSVGGALNVTGNVSGAKFIGDVAFESIKDTDGHNRFIEGDITIETLTGVTQQYGKWSLSGSHLMIVIACQLAPNTSLTNGQKLADINLPSWILDKIVAIYGSLVGYSFVSTVSENYDIASLKTYMNKGANNLSVIINQNYSTTYNEVFRYEFDLLIDNE